MTMIWNDKVEQLAKKMPLSEETQAAIGMFLNSLRFNGIDAEEVHVCFDDDGVLHKWNQFDITIPPEYADMDEAERTDFINKEVYKRLGAKDYFYNLPRQQKVMDFAYLLHELGVDVKVVSCSIDTYTDDQKYRALSEQMPWLDSENIILLPDGMGKNKLFYLPQELRDAKDDVIILIDDHTPNCRGFMQYGDSSNTIAVKCLNDINGKGKNGAKSWKGPVMNYDNIGSAFNALHESISQIVKTREKADMEEVLDFAGRL